MATEPATDETESVDEFVRRWLPAAPAHVLEVGSGSGELAEGLRRDGWDVTAIDPRRDIRRGVVRVDVERLRVDEPFDAVVAIRSLHHLSDVAEATAKIARLMADGGVIVVQDFAWDLVDLAAADWMHGEAKRLGLPRVHDDPVGFYERWREERRRLATFEELDAALASSFDEVEREWIPYLADEHLEGDDLARRREVERLKSGRMRPVAFRYVGRRA
jgi:SAM-dependent methyltransferase